MRYVEFCAGIGGSRAGLEAAGWQCDFAIDNDPDAIAVHKLVHGSGELADIQTLAPKRLPDADVWVAGFPCQPFSSSGTRQGFGHSSGHVFEHLVRLMRARRPTVAVFENVVGLLSNKGGHTFAKILSLLTELGYTVDWLVIDLSWLDIPQTRPRLFFVAVRSDARSTKAAGVSGGERATRKTESRRSIFAPFIEEKAIVTKERGAGSLSESVDVLKPLIGKPHRVMACPFGRLGYAENDAYRTYDITNPNVVVDELAMGMIVAPDFPEPASIRSVRFWSPEGGGGIAGLHVRSEPLSHCVGTSLGGAPLFSVPLRIVKNVRAREAFLRHSNWHREQDDRLIMRLRPDRAALLFGAHTGEIQRGLQRWESGDTRKYKLVGNLVGPAVALRLAELVKRHIA